VTATATLFDFNGVLVDDEHVHLAAFRDVVAPLGITLTDEAYVERYMGFDDRGAFTAMLKDAGHTLSGVRIAALVRAKKPAYMARIAVSLRIFPGAAELVRRRAARGVVGIVSGALEHEIRYCLGRMGVADLVAFIVPAEATKACKPDPEGYLLGKSELAKRGASGGRAVVVEDSIAGVQAAKAAGLRCAAVAHTHDAAALAAAGADVVAKTIAELTDAMLDGEAA
jgi:beta-phosphoglucomutase